MDSITDALSFFRQSCGRWRSQRSQHHLLHRRAEAGASLVEVAMVEADDPRLSALAELHKMDPAAVVGPSSSHGTARSLMKPTNAS